MVALRERIAFAAGDTGFNFVWQTIELYLLFYYVRVLGIAPEQAALIFLAGAAIDLIGDPLIGALVDRTRLSLSARGWVLAAGPPLGLALALAFLPSPFEGTGGIAFLSCLHVLLRVSYSLGNIPYAALTARITPDPAMQVRLTGYRMQGAAVGGLIAATVYLVYPLSERVWGVPLGAVLLGLAAQPLFLFCALGVRERVVPPLPPRPELSAQFRGMAELLRGSDELRRLLGLNFFAGIACTLLYKGTLFVFDQLDALGWGYGAALFPSIVLFLGAPFWTALATRIGCSAVTRIAAALFLGAILFAWASTASLPLVAVAMALAAFASVGMSVMFFAFVPGVVQSCERALVAEGCAARVFGLSNLARKLAQATAPQAIALALLLPGGDIFPALALAALLALAAAIWSVPRTGPLPLAEAA